MLLLALSIVLSGLLGTRALVAVLACGERAGGGLLEVMGYRRTGETARQQGDRNEQDTEVSEALEEGGYHVTSHYQRCGRGDRSFPPNILSAMSPMEPGSLPKPGEAAKAAFTRLVPDQPNVALRPMFGNLAAFVNGNLFAGLFGEDLFVRLPDAESVAVKARGGRDFEPMPGRAMKGYVIVPKTWRNQSDATIAWIKRALELTGAMPPKTAKPKSEGKKPIRKR
jgi:TfoX/Sxy family transcriptional regulator of competence genes